MNSFSIVIPTCNGERYIEQAIESVAAQTRRPCEIVVVDDSSKDSTVDIIKGFGASYQGVPMRSRFEQENSGGPARPINLGVMDSVGEIVLVLDQDDRLRPDAVENILKAEALAPSAQLFFHLSEAVGACGLIQSETALAEIRSGVPKVDGLRVALQGQLTSSLIRHGNFLVGFPGFAFRRQAFLDIGGVDESLLIAGDLDLLARFFEKYTSVFIDKIGYEKRNHDANVCRNRIKTYREIVLVLAACGARAIKRGDFHHSQMARENIEVVAYWFRKANRFREANDFYRSLRQVGVSNLRVRTLITKTLIEQSFALATWREPRLSGFTRES